MENLDLFNTIPTKDLPGTPLPERMRPVQLAEFIGQDKVKEQIELFVKSNHLPSLILWGPPGTGKTTLALLLSKLFKIDFRAVNATESGTKDLREIGEQARMKRLQYQTRTLLFVDEIHRFNKGQQDVLLPFVEKGDIVLVGATTENPSYELNRALLSRCRTLVLERLSPQQQRQVLQRAAVAQSQTIESLFLEEALDLFVDWADGDARRMLATFEEILALASSQQIKTPINAGQLTEILGRSTLGYDKNSQQHYDVISAFIKSIRGSDADAGLYYLARMIKGGEDPMFIARRLMILASEDIGNADPRAITVAVSGAQAVEMIGWPEGAITLAQVVCYLASAPKSNRSYKALGLAKDWVEKTGTVAVPVALRSGAVPKDVEQTKNYRYAHDYPKGWTEQNYFPEGAEPPTPFYQPSAHGFEKQISEFQKWLKGK